MNPKERFLSAIKREAVDRVPLFDFLFQRPLYTELIGRTPENYNGKDAIKMGCENAKLFLRGPLGLL